MTTVRDLLTDTLRDINELALGETATNDMAQDALRQLVRMLDQWAIQSLAVYATDPQVFTLTLAKQVYTIGPGGDFNVPRPAMIAAAYWRDIQGQDYPIQISTDYTDYAGISAKNVTSTLPIFIFDDGGVPLRNLTMYPIPTDTTKKLVLWTWTPITTASDLDATVNLPPGYEQAIIDNLGNRIMKAYGMVVDADRRAAATASMAIIKRANLTIPTLTSDFSTRGYFDIRTGLPAGKV